MSFCNEIQYEWFNIFFSELYTDSAVKFVLSTFRSLVA